MYNNKIPIIFILLCFSQASVSGPWPPPHAGDIQRVALRALSGAQHRGLVRHLLQLHLLAMRLALHLGSNSGRHRTIEKAT